MYAIIEDSGSQIKVSEGQEIFVARRELADDVATVVFNKVLFVSDAEGEEDESASGDGSDGTDVKIGEPYVDGAKVTADILAEVRSPKVPVVKFKRRKNYIRRKSHRQDLLKVKITSIQS
jgi:large subunit ribosomal protein L21